MSGFNFAKLREMEKLAHGNPAAIAKYSAAKREYDDTIATMFPEDAPIQFVESPTESYLKEAEARAAETGDADDIARAAILRDRYEYYQGLKTAHLDYRTTGHELRTKLQSGEPLTDRDVQAAHRFAKLYPSTENVVLFTTIKRAVENPQERPVGTEPVVSKITAEDVEAARQAAQANPTASNIARFSALKRHTEGVQ